MDRPAAHLQDVSNAILLEIQGVMGLTRDSWTARLVGALFGRSARRMANLLVQLDHDIASAGLSAGAGNLLARLIQDYQVNPPEAIPREGPLLVASNHPGAYDLLILVASLGRDDLKIISSDISILRHLPSIAPHFIPISEDPHGRMAAFRSGLRHLLDGKALLLFPRGDVEIDPALSPEAFQGMASWSPSLELFLRRAPETRVVVAIVGGVLSARWFEHPFVHIWKKTEQRQKVAEIIQVAEQLVLSRKPPLRPRVLFSPPMVFSQVGGPGELMRTLTGTARAQLARFIHRGAAERRGS
ncbi:MAG: hypothetical protein P8Y03_22655 [Anaerolineales bacterium]